MEKVSMPQESSEETQQCKIHPTQKIGDVDKIHQKVCANELPLIEHSDGNYYCLFHLPTKEKDIALFEKTFRKKLNAVKAELAGIEKLPESNREAAKSKLQYDFRYVWVPSPIVLHNYNFEVEALFGGAVFSEEVNLYMSTFAGSAGFSNTIFLATASFNSVKFMSWAWFGNTVFY